MTQFTGYPQGAMALLSQIGRCDRAEFDLLRPRYESEIAAPTKAFVTDMGAVLDERISPDIEAVPKVNGSISPINNDLRFHPGAPYKDALLLRFWEGEEKKAAPTLFMRIQEDAIGFGSGRSLEGDALTRYRSAVASDEGAELTQALAPILRKRDAALAGMELKRVPAGFDPDHPRADLLRHKWFQVRWLEPTPKSIASARFVDWSSRRLEQLADVHRWLRDRV